MVLFILACFSPLLLDINSERKKNAKYRKRLNITREDRRGALAAAYAQGKISQQEFESKLGEILAE